MESSCRSTRDTALPAGITSAQTRPARGTSKCGLPVLVAGNPGEDHLDCHDTDLRRCDVHYDEDDGSTTVNLQECGRMLATPRGLHPSATRRRTVPRLYLRGRIHDNRGLYGRF